MVISKEYPIFVVKSNNKHFKNMKKYIMLEISIPVDTEIENVCDVVDNLDIKISSASENVEVTGDPSVDNFYYFEP